MGHLVVGILAFLNQWLDGKGIIMSGSVIWLYLAYLWFKNYMTGRGRMMKKVLVLVVSTTVVCSLVFDLESYLMRCDYHIQTAWNYVVSYRLPAEFPLLFHSLSS